MGRKIHLARPALCGDNAAMIAAAAYFEYMEGNLADSSLNASALDGI
jgi:tRNA A37 threonylcarbamoyltransferase TsaD